MTLEAFNVLIAKGEKLVIIDDLIIDVSKFMHEHPGGTFSISHNIGRDVSKFFYGGYSLENVKKVKEYAHSAQAMKVV